MTPEQFAAIVGALAVLCTAVAGMIGAIARLYVLLERNRRALDGRLSDLVAANRTAGHAEGMLLAEQLRNPQLRDDPPGGERRSGA